jgi:formylglycine-generating enzyme required for sulfatase activity
MRIQAGLWLMCIALANSASATPFSYQGRLLQAGIPANGRYDLRFELFLGDTGGSAIAPTLTNAEVAVADGVFTTILDFGTNAFFGAGCWLEIGVRPAGAPASFVTLSPRQPLTPAPFSIYTLKAESLTGPIPDSQLSTNVARLDSDQTFRGKVTFSSEVAFSARQMQRLWRVSIPFVTVTNAGNEADFTGKGAVPYNFRIGKYEINNNQYCAFLNAVAADDPKRLYSTEMDSSEHGGILRSGSPGEYHYTVKPGREHQPVVFVDFYDVLRFCNWLHNGQPSGSEDNSTTEDGAYSLTAEALAAENVLRNANARYWLPSDDEWYKAAYHQPEELGGDPSNYWFFPNRSNDAPISEPPPGGINSANSCCDSERRAVNVGSYVQSISFYGTFDQAGNVQEWTEWTNEFTYLRNRRVRGGSWVYNEFYSRSTDFEFDTTDYDAEAIGFRVAGAVE